MDWQVFVIPQDSFIVYIQRLSLFPFFSLSLHLFRLLWFCRCLPLYALSFVFYLVFKVGSLPTFVPQKALRPCSCCLRSVAVVPECLYPPGEASSTAPFLNASRRIVGHVALLLTSVALSSTFLQFSWQLLTVYLSPKAEQHWYLEVLEYLTELSELVHS